MINAKRIGQVLCLLALATAQASGVLVTLKPFSGTGYTTVTVWDTEISGYQGQSVETFYNYGGQPDAKDLFASTRFLLVKFDLNAVPNLSQVTGVNSATLRLYRQSYMFNNSNLQATQLAEDWVAGTGNGQWDGACNGAQWYARTAGTTVPYASLISDGGGIYHINGVTNLADDPAHTGRKFVRQATSNGPGNYYNAEQQGAYTAYNSLADLAAAGSTRGYFWDSAAARLYVNKNDTDVRWYGTSDVWTTPGGTVTGSSLNDMSYPAPPAAPPSWLQFDISSFVRNWLVNGQPNYGVRISQPSSCQNEIYTSEYTTDPTLRPELVLDLNYGPPPTQPAIQLLPSALSFTGKASDPLPAAQSVTVHNSGVGTLHWTAVVRAPAPTWLSVNNASGGNDGTFSVSVNWQDMAAGNYTAYVDVADPNALNSPQAVTVTLHVQPPPQPTIALVPGSLTFTGHAADPAPAAQSVTVQNSGAGTLHWTASVRSPAPAWVSLTNPNGTDNGTFSVSANWQGLAAGTYTAYVDVADPNATNTPQTLTVTMQVQPPPQPTLKLVPGVLVFMGLPTDPPPPSQTVTVQNTGQAVSHWTAAIRSPAPAWVSLNNASGTDNGTFTVGANWQSMTPGVYTAYIDVSDPSASNSPQTATVTMQVRSQFDVSTQSFTNSSRGTHPNTLTTGGGNITVNLSSLPAGAQVFRAILVPHSSSFNGSSGGATQPLKVQSADAPGVWLQTAAPRYLTLDCTAAVQRALLATDKTLHLNLVSFPAGLGSEVRLDVWSNTPAARAIQQVSNLQAVHRDGDTMLTFAEVNPPVTNPTPTDTDLNNAQAAMDTPNEIRYRIYRSAQPIDGSVVRTAELVDEIAPMSGWNWTITVDTVNLLPIADMTPSTPGTGIYVRRAQAAGSAYYAVSRAVNGEEDFSGWVSSVSSLAAPVAENTGTGMVLQYRQVGPVDWFFETGITRYYFVKWECPPNWNAPSYAHNYMVCEPSLQVSPRPVDVALHCWGGNMEGGYGWWYEASNGSLLVASNEIPYDWWTGFHENSGTIRPWTSVEGSGGGVVRNYSTKRVWSFVNDFVARRWTIDPNHILLSGNSMGGSGSSMWGIMAGDKFAYIDSWVGVHIPALCDYFRGSYEQCWGLLAWNCLCEDSGQTVWDFWDTNQWLRNHVSTETPFIAHCNGKNDGAIGWYQAYLFARALQETRRPHLFYWSQNGHNTRAALPGTLSDRYIGIDIDKNKTLPAFTYCSLDNNIGNGSDTDGDLVGFYNAYLLWQPSDSIDTAGSWEMTCLLINSAPQATCTVDITPRRCQAFKPAAGRTCTWTNTDIATGTVIASGTATVDANGLVTLPQMTVSKTKNRIKITAPNLTGDINGDGYVNVGDLQLLVAKWGRGPSYTGPEDINGDGFVNVGDLQLLVANWGRHL